MSDLKNELDQFLGNISATQSLLRQTKSHLTNHKKNSLEGWKDITFKPRIMSSTLVKGDLTGPSDDGWKIYYPTGFHITVELNQLGESIDILISRDSMRSVATCYEILESFLFDITGIFLEMNTDLINKANKIKDPNEFDGDCKQLLRKYYRSKNNKELIKLIGKLSENFSRSETENTPRIKLKDWYYVLSNVRHAIVHSLFKLNLKKVNFNPYQLKVFNKYFQHRKSNEMAELDVSFESANRQIKMIAEYGFLIFKCFCIDMKKDWKVFKHM